MLLHLVRHGLSEWNVEGRVQGHLNSDLTEVGRQQAIATGLALAQRSISALYASDLDRARQTAEHISQATGLEVRLDPRIREASLGIFEGLTWPEIETRYPDESRALKDSGGYDYTVPGAESRAQTLERALAAFSEIALRHPEQQVVAVTHGGLMSAFLRYVLSIPPNTRPAFKTANGSISTFEPTTNGWRLLTWGAVDHLAPSGPVATPTA